MPSLRSFAKTSKVDSSAWKRKFASSGTRSETRNSDFRGGHEFLALEDLPIRSHRSSSSTASYPGSSLSNNLTNARLQSSFAGHHEIVDLTADDEPLTSRASNYSVADDATTLARTISQPAIQLDIPCSATSSHRCPPDSQNGLQLAITDTKQSYDIVEAKAKVGFLSLPAEIRLHIVRYIETDFDIVTFMQVCKRFKSIVDESFWHKRALANFDPIPAVTRTELVNVYKAREQMARSYFHIHELTCSSEEARIFWIKLRDLILQSDGQIVSDNKKNKVYVGLNQEFLKELVVKASGRYLNRRKGTNILELICGTRHFSSKASLNMGSSRSSESQILVIQLCLLHLVLDPGLCNSRAQHFNESQYIVYQARQKQPLFGGKFKDELNLTWFLNVANFFKFHFKQGDGEGILEHTYSVLSNNERPRPWVGKLDSETKELGRHWKGAYAFVDHKDLDVIRSSRDHEDVIDQHDTENNGFQDLTFFFDIENHIELHVPVALANICVPSGPQTDYVTKETFTPKVKNFFGLGSKGIDSAPYHVHGRMYALPPQQRIPGFNRISMLAKYQGDDNEWAFEGVVLPGSQIMLGRWFCIQNDQYSGPFMYWSVQEPPNGVDNTIEDAIRFMNVLDL